MLFYVAAALAFLGALWWMPIRIESRADLNRTPTLHVIFWVWKWRFAYDAVLERTEGSLALRIRRRGTKPKADPSNRTFVTSLQDVASGIRFFRANPRIIRGFRLQKLSMAVRIGTGDAAHTALLHGACCASLAIFARIIFQRSGVRPTLRAISDYRRAVFLGSVDCIIAFHIGNIICTALRIGLVRLKKYARRIGA